MEDFSIGDRRPEGERVVVCPHCEGPAVVLEYADGFFCECEESKGKAIFEADLHPFVLPIPEVISGGK